MKNYRLNFEKLQEVEKSFESSPVCKNILQTMTTALLHSNDKAIDIGLNYTLAVNTLKEMGVLEETESSQRPILLKS